SPIVDGAKARAAQVQVQLAVGHSLLVGRLAAKLHEQPRAPPFGATEPDPVHDRPAPRSLAPLAAPMLLVPGAPGLSRTHSAVFALAMHLVRRRPALLGLGRLPFRLFLRRGAGRAPDQRDHRQYPGSTDAKQAHAGYRTPLFESLATGSESTSGSV